MAYIVSKNEDELTEVEIIEYVEEKAAPYKRLRGGLEFISAIPKTENGEVLRTELRERQRRGKKALTRRSSSFWNEDRRFSTKRHSMGPSIKARINNTIVEEMPRNVARSQSCVLL